ncbi:PAS domain-containing sensor histidine kinase [Virgibacillus phasianinus]|uniref:histidine kinase n=1 Tax=Virgibacillus phasianinus TaxID=2017483 RepID=A0A220U572_9BACI|nr:HAMP domain-containing sensor histidine kinase [Virgibacillus phasianinus]ASK62991.1 PAS domain-containing sensor histidine kinase [Virgibacillus phasianinus]
MRYILRKPLITYVIGILIVVLLTGAVISRFTSELIILFAVLLVQFVIVILMLLHIFEKYMKPIRKATKTVDELVKGNYRARIHHASNGSVGELSNKINILARNLSELTIQEDIHEKQLVTVIDNTESGLVLIDEKGYIHLVNRKFISLFGNTPKDYKGHLYYDVLDNEKIHHLVQQTFLYEENVKESFTQIINFDKKYIQIIGAPIFNEKKMLKGAVLVFYDITELKKLELTRKDFVANVSHELKTPITSIKGFAETLLDNKENNPEVVEKFHQIIYDESDRLQILIQDLLTLSKLEKDEFELQVTDFHIGKVIEEVIAVIHQQAEQKGLNLTVDVEKDIKVKADREQMKQVLFNLLANAVSYTPGKGEITLMIEKTDSNMHIAVSDSGIGIGEEAIPRLFERFYRVDKARSRNTGGTGLGLAIVKHIVEVHEGKIKVDSELDKGSTFHVYIPTNLG